MATVTISSEAVTFTARITTSGSDSPFGPVKVNIKGTSQIITLDLSALGSSHVVTNVYLQYSSSSTGDCFYLKGPVNSMRLKHSPTVNQLNALKDYMTGETLSLTLLYNGRPESVTGNRTYDFITQATFSLIVELESEPVVEQRSAGTLSATSVDIGQGITLNITPFRNTYQHRVTWGMLLNNGSISETYRSSVTVDPDDTSEVLEVPMETNNNWANAIPSSAAGTMRVILDTLRPVDGGTYVSVGTREFDVRVIVPNTADFKPSASGLSCTTYNPSVLRSDNVFAGVSQLGLTLNGVQTKYGAGIQSIVYSGWGSVVTAATTTIRTDTVQLSGNLRLKAVLTDTRGLQAAIAYTYDVTALRFTPPAFVMDPGPVCVRCTPEGHETDRGTALKVSASFTCDTQTIPGNTARAFVFIRPYRSDTWLPADGVELTSGVERVMTSVDIGFELSHDVSYEVRFVVQDTVMAVDMLYMLRSLQYALHFSNSGRAVGVGQQAEALGTSDLGRFDVNPEWTVHLGSNTYIGGKRLDVVAIDALISTFDYLAMAVSLLQEQVKALQTTVSNIQNQPESSG